jgi:Flp pilus assembly protein TadD
VSLYQAHRYDEAITQLRTALAIDPDDWFAREWLGRAYARLGRFPEATAELRTAQQGKGSGNAEIESALGRVYADAGNRAEATNMLEHLRQRKQHELISAAFLATVQVGLGATDDAFASLTQANAQRSWFVVMWKVDPELDPLRSDPRFAALLKQAGFEP